MSVQVLGISGSPILNSNTDRAIQAVLQATGAPCEFIKLMDIALQPCRACLSCVGNNQCTIEDGASTLVDKLRWAKALVIGGYTPYGSLDARTKAFMERVFCLRHRVGLNRGKIGAAVVTTAMDPERADLPAAGDIAARQFGSWMAEEGMTNMGTLVLIGNVPCIRCGYGDDCSMSGIRMIEGSQATVASVGVRRFENGETMLDRARELGRKIGEAIQKQAV